MNKPYFASRNHAILSSCEAGAGNGGPSDTGGRWLALFPRKHPQAKRLTNASDSTMTTEFGNLVLIRVIKFLNCPVLFGIAALIPPSIKKSLTLLPEPRAPA